MLNLLEKRSFYWYLVAQLQQHQVKFCTRSSYKLQFDMATATALRAAGNVLTTRTVPREVTCVFSKTNREARMRVLNLYRSWYRQIPFILMDHDIQKSTDQCRARMKELFEVNKHVEDVRAIDILVAKGQMDLRETIEVWKQKTHVMMFFRPELTPDVKLPKPRTSRPLDPIKSEFLKDFLKGHP